MEEQRGRGGGKGFCFCSFFLSHSPSLLLIEDLLLIGNKFSYLPMLKGSPEGKAKTVRALSGLQSASDVGKDSR